MAVRIDRSSFTTCPRGSGRQLMSLGRVLRKYTPKNPAPVVAAKAERLDVALTYGTAVYADHIRNNGPSALAMDREDDGFADALLTIGRTRLEHWQVFERPTAARLATLPAQEIDYDELRVRAVRARELYDRLFAAGFDATRAPYAEQAEYLLALEHIIVGDELGDDLDELIGEPFHVALRQTVHRYQQMVQRRQSGDPGNTTGLREVVEQLQRAIQDYMLALLVTVDDDDPDSVAQVRRALGPVDAFRAQLAARRSRGGQVDSAAADTGDAGPDANAETAEDANFAELLAEQEAVDAELGLTDGAGADLA